MIRITQYLERETDLFRNRKTKHTKKKKAKKKKKRTTGKKRKSNKKTNAQQILEKNYREGGDEDVGEGMGK